jgi:hypothetical protein
LYVEEEGELDGPAGCGFQILLGNREDAAADGIGGSVEDRTQGHFLGSSYFSFQRTQPLIHTCRVSDS